MSVELFLEIGTEEIPAGFLPVAMEAMEARIRQELEHARVGFDAVRTFSTPRRLALSVTGVALQQERQELEITGPPARIAFDADGNPTKAAIGFAKTNGVDVSELQTVSTPKGDYLGIRKVDEGGATAELLPELLPRLIQAIPFKKSMRWKDLDQRFARPVHWVVALFDGKVVPFAFAGLTSGNNSQGHRFMAPQAFEVTGAEHYVQACEEHRVIVDIERRRGMVAEQVEQAGKDAGGAASMDADLLDEVTNLVEYPQAIFGTFDEEFLQLPDELLITSMKEHQRYFTVSQSDGTLLNRFITVSNNLAKDLSVVVKGNERVLRARLADAMFFWQEDQKVKLEVRLDALKNVVYQKKLGTSFEKVERFRTLAVELAEQFDTDAKALTERAATLAKCDLETGMVYEFPELQGIMGREYATLEGEAPRVCTAISEHYLPVSAGGDLPSDNVGAFVSLADKVDTICGCFGVGLIPTGTADPYALRRNAIGVLNIILDRGFALDLPALVERSLVLLEPKLTRPLEDVRNDVLTFIQGRFENMLTGQGQPTDVVGAVCAATFAEPLDTLKRVEALAELKGQDDFEPLAVAFKRVVNIIKGGVDTPVSADLFEDASESALFEALQRVQAQVAEMVQAADYASALKTIAGLRPAVDDFFDNVMVMAEDEAVKTNRLALLTGVARLFNDIADFARLD